MNIAFLTSGHYPYDDRIYYHLGRTLCGMGHKVLIISSMAETKEEAGAILINSFYGQKLGKKEKVRTFRELLEPFSPDLAICSEPLPIIAAKEYRRTRRKNLKIIYDITEWYPSGRFLKEYRRSFRWFGFLKLLFFNIYASSFSNAFIFGEWSKSKPYRLLFPFTAYKFITYYPDLKYISYKKPSFSGKKLRLSYSGEISIEKGFGNFLKVVYGLADIYRDLEIEVKMVAWYGTEHDKKECEPLIHKDYENIAFSLAERQNFIDFTGCINDTDIFVDLRQINPENKYSLPIKLFYYIAMGRPVIFSDLNAIRHDVEIEKFGFLVNPENTEGIIALISDYIKDPDLYNDHCLNARKMAEEKYNWGTISPEFQGFIGSF